MDLLGQSALILAVTALSLAITVVTRNFRNRLGQTYGALSGVIAIWSFSFFLERLLGAPLLYRLHLALNVLLAPMALFFTSVFTRVHDESSVMILKAALVYSVPLFLIQWTPLFDWDSVRWLTFAAPFFLAFECAHLMLIDLQMRKGLRRSQKLSTVGLTKRTWIYIGAFLVLALCSMDHFPGLGEAIPSVGNVFLCIYLFLISEAVTQQRLLNVSALINRILVLVFLCLCLTVIYTLLVAWIQNAPGLFVLNSFLASFIIVILIEPIRRLANVGFVQLFYRQQIKVEQKVSSARQALIGVLDASGVAQVTLGFLDHVLNPDSASIFILRSDGTKFRRVRGLRDDSMEARDILASHPCFEFLHRMKRRGEAPVILDTYLENEIDRTTSVAQKQTFQMVLEGLRGLHANILIPFYGEQSVLGFVAVRAVAPPEPWGGNWGILSVIYPFFSHAARVLQNTDVFQRLREKDRLAALGEMAAGLAHEIRNPLVSIKGAAELLDTTTGEEQQRFVSVIVEEVKRLNQVVSQFLDYSKPLTLDRRDCDVAQLLEKVQDFFRASSYSGVEIKMVWPSSGSQGLPPLRCNPEQIKQVLVNFVQNAVHSIRKKGESSGLVQIGALIQGAPSGRREFVIFVEDNGIGISKDHLEKIFIPFFTTHHEGTGLGLSISSRIMEAHGGRIDVQSEEGRFARFSLCFPDPRQTR